MDFLYIFTDDKCDCFVQTGKSNVIHTVPLDDL